MVKVTLNNLVPSTVPAQGWLVKFRIKGSTGAYNVATGSPFMTLPIVFNTTDPAGTLYEGTLRCDCRDLESTDIAWTTICTCNGTGYVVSQAGTECVKTETIPAIVTNSAYCLAPSINPVYSSYGARIYNVGFTLQELLSYITIPSTGIDSIITTPGQWANPTESDTTGPMNRESVWIDRNCDGNRDALTITQGPLIVGASYNILSYQIGDDFTNVNGNNSNGAFIATGTTPANWTNGTVVGISKTTIAFTFNNTGNARTVFVGVAGDNQFRLQVNSSVIVDTGITQADTQFKIWHLIPVILLSGANYFNITALGDGSSNDAIAMVVYDNSIAELQAATADNQLNVLYKTSALRGTTYDVATCQNGYNLDMSGGTGNYSCKRVLTKVCNSVN